MNLGKPQTDITAFTSLQKAGMAITTMAAFPGNNSVVVIFRNKISKDIIITQTGFFLSFNTNPILEVPEVKIHIQSS